ncbi:MAG TPA: endolytic transglycosylase MltG, partial [Pseudonocardiaceae bacterium]
MTDDLGLFGSSFRDGADSPEPPHPRRPTGRRERRRARERRRRRVVLGALIVVLILAVGGAFVGVRQLLALWEVPDFAGPGGTEVLVHVEEGQSLSAIGASLARQDVVASVRAFTVAAAADPRVQAVQPGYYQLRARMSGSAAVARLQERDARVGQLEIRGGEQLDNVGLPDGKTVPGLLTEISRASCAMIGGASTCVSPEELRTTMGQTDLTRLGVPAWANDPMSRVEPRRRLEGLLVPGNYDVRPGSSAGELLLQVTDASVARLLASGFPASAAGTGYNAYQVLVIASVIEREAITPDFRRVS